jgi:hypothetical protein
MDQSRLIGEIANDMSHDYTEPQAPSGGRTKEIRVLNDLEMVLAGGGDGIVIW